MRTEHVSILLPELIRGSLGREETDRVEAHLRSCPSCRSEFDELSYATSAIDRRPLAEVPKSYFASILPRVHNRLERQRDNRWMADPLVNKVVLPLGAAIVVVLLVWQLPAFSPGYRNPLLAVVDSASADEIAEIVQNDVPNHEAGSMNNALIAGMLANETFVDRQLVREALANESTSPFNVYADVSPQEFLDNLGESDANNVLLSLETKGSL
ncbi:MAG TPA: zf-HC2 domain-containing protein [Bacteroidota bacterium]